VLLQGTDTSFKNELLFSQFGINYAQLPEQFRKVISFIRFWVPAACKAFSATCHTCYAAHGCVPLLACAISTSNQLEQPAICA
jgi:tRNA(His) 5'-end guanylyltransferase